MSPLPAAVPALVSTMMKPYLQEKLSCDDRTLFTQCACHVFADELTTKLYASGFVLSRLADLNRTAPQMQALHVFSSNDDVMIDVEGVKKVDDYLASSREYRLAHDGPPSRFEMLDCPRDELFQVVPMAKDETRGSRNKWGHLINPDFVVECRRRAQALLAARPEMYGLC